MENIFEGNVLQAQRFCSLQERINNAAKQQGHDGQAAVDMISVIAGLKYLLKDKTVNGEEQKFLPLSVKEEVFHLVFPNGYIHVDVDFNRDEGLASATAYVYAEEGKCIGEGIADQKMSELPIFDSIDRKRQAVRRFAYGRAKSEALRAAGIASWFSDDMQLDDAIDRADEDVNNSLEAEDATAEVESKVKKEDKEEPTQESTAEAPVSKTNPKRKMNKRFEKKAEEPAEAAYEVPFDPDKKEESDEEMIRISNEEREAGKSYIFEKGKYKGKTIDEIAVTDPEFLVLTYAYYKQGKVDQPDMVMINEIVATVTENKNSVFTDEMFSKYGVSMKDVAV